MEPVSVRALVSHGDGHAAVSSVELLEGQPGGFGEVLAAGVCGTDVELFRGNSLTERIGPLVLGHENVVRISGLDRAASVRWNATEGDRVLVEEYVPCGQCPTCRAGRYRVCPATDFTQPEFVRYGRMPVTELGPWGGFGDQLYLHPHARLHPVPAELPSHVATLAVPLANAHRWLARVAGIKVGDTVVIIGPGALGLCTTLMARLAGASFVGLIGIAGDEPRLAQGRALGADLATVADADTTQLIRDATAGRMADIVVDATGGATSALDLAGALAGVGADVVLAGARASVTTSLLAAAATHEISIHGVRGHDGISIAAALRLLVDEQHTLSPIVSPPVGLDDAAATLARLSTADPARPIHVSIVPRSEF